jgi:autotransporter-associated beta strand protein
MKTTYLKSLFPLLAGLAAIAGTLNLHAADLTWDADNVTSGAQDGAGNWSSANANWWDGFTDLAWNNDNNDNAIFGAGGGANFSVTVPGNTTNNVANITFNANGSAGYNIAAGSSSTSKINLTGNPVITVGSGAFATNNVVFSGTSFTKLGAGTLVLKPGANNINSGPTVVGEGTLVIGSTASRLLIPGDLTITNGATARLGQAEQIADSGIITVDDATFDSGGRSETIGGFVLVSGQVTSSSSSQAITNNGAIYDLRSGFFFPNMAGTAGLTKTTSGMVVLTNGGGVNSFSGPVLVSDGILELGHSVGAYALPAVTITITNSGMIRLGKDNQIHPGATVVVAGGTYELLAHNGTNAVIILDNNGQILNGGSTSKTLGAATQFDVRSGLCASVLGGSGGLVKSTAGTVTLTMDNAYAGGTLVSAGILQLGDGSGVNRGNFGSGPVTNDAAVVLNHSGAFTLANDISGSGVVTNLGGSPSLTGNNSYAGGTTVAGGTLYVNNATGSGTGSGAVNVQAGAGLGGAGTIGGVVNIRSGASLSPGNGNIGTLTITGNLTLDAGSSCTFDVNGSTPASDSVALQSGVAYGGVLNIIAAGTFTPGQEFQLFSGPGATNPGNFASLTGSPGANMAFTFTNGVLSVVSTVTTPPTLGSSLSGGTLTFTWSEAGFKLQSLTNDLSSGIWGDYPGGGSSPVNVTVDPAGPNVFFRLSQ